MKFVSYLSQQQPAFGVVLNNSIVNVTDKLDGVATLKDAITCGKLLELATIASNQSPDVAIADAVFLPVIPNPNKIFCVGLNYESHRLETGRPQVAYPTIFCRFADTQVGHKQPLICPSVSTEFDYEGELAFIIGKEGRHITVESAMDYVAGYSCYNDASVRDWQYHTSQFIPGKNFPGTGALGPYLVTKEEISDLATSQLETHLNGVLMQSVVLSDMIFSIADLICYISTFTRLYPGDIICTGTPSGVGHMRAPPVFMQAGDDVSVTISGIGSLQNSVVAES